MFDFIFNQIWLFDRPNHETTVDNQNGSRRLAKAPVSLSLERKLNFRITSYLFSTQRQKKLIQEEEHKQLLEKRAQYVEATKNLLKFTPAAEAAKIKSSSKKV